MNASMDDEIKYKLLSLLNDKPQLTQREMTQELDMSLGKINSCISAIEQEGFIRIERYKNDSNKNAFIYRITQSGSKKLSILTIKYLKSKLKEFKHIKKEVKHLSGKLNQMDINLDDHPDLLAELKKNN